MSQRVDVDSTAQERVGEDEDTKLLDMNNIDGLI